MVLSSDNFLLCVAIGCFLIIVTSGIIYTVWCSKCCRIPKGDPEEKAVRRIASVPEGNAFYTTPWTMTSDHLAVQHVLSHPQLTNDFYYFSPMTGEIGNGNLTDDLNHIPGTMSTPTDTLGGLGMVDAMDEDEENMDIVNCEFGDGEGQHDMNACLFN